MDPGFVDLVVNELLAKSNFSSRSLPKNQIFSEVSFSNKLHVRIGLEIVEN